MKEEEKGKRFIVLSGRSGSGKTVALRQLEDAGFYCVDNLPAGLIEPLLKQTLHSAEPVYKWVAVAVDARNLESDMTQVTVLVERQRSEEGLRAEIIYLDADDATLQRRFQETRRRHPLSSASADLKEAIAREQTILAPLREKAGLCINTSTINLHELQDKIVERVVGPEGGKDLSLQFLSFGYKSGVPPDADLVFDARCLPNPHWESSLKNLTGCDRPVVDFLDSKQEAKELLADIQSYLEKWLPLLESRSYLTVAVGCTGGQHRSVYMCEQLQKCFQERFPHVLVSHREHPKS